MGSSCECGKHCFSKWLKEKKACVDYFLFFNPSDISLKEHVALGQDASSVTKHHICHHPRYVDIFRKAVAGMVTDAGKQYVLFIYFIKNKKD